MSVSHPVRLLREELQLLQEQGSYVGEVVRAMDKKKVLVKVKARLTPREQPKAQRIPTRVCSIAKTLFYYFRTPGSSWARWVVWWLSGKVTNPFL